MIVLLRAGTASKKGVDLRDAIDWWENPGVRLLDWSILDAWHISVTRAGGSTHAQQLLVGSALELSIPRLLHGLVSMCAPLFIDGIPSHRVYRPNRCSTIPHASSAPSHSSLLKAPLTSASLRPRTSLGAGNSLPIFRIKGRDDRRACTISGPSKCTSGGGRGSGSG